MAEQKEEQTHDGGCLCGAVRYRTLGALRPVVNCHCTQCRRTSGHFVAATEVDRKNLEFTESNGLSWYHSSDFARRGFCNVCGSSLFWERLEPPGRTIAVMAGTLDAPTGLSTVLNIYTHDAGDYYSLDAGLPQADDTSSVGWG